jgi:hypothetical protein
VFEELQKVGKVREGERGDQEQAGDKHVCTAVRASGTLTTTTALELVRTAKKRHATQKSNFRPDIVIFHEEFEKAYVSRLMTKLEQRNVRKMDSVLLFGYSDSCGALQTRAKIAPVQCMQCRELITLDT